MSIKAQNISFAYHKKAILKEISLVLQPGTLGVIMGPNGSGKSTLLKIINRLLEPQSGTIFIAGDDYRKLP